jgi:hypothetical protein
MQAFRIGRSRSLIRKWIALLFFMPLMLVSAFSTSTPASYLDSLNHVASYDDLNNINAEGDSALRPFGMPAEEYYGFTNPMANCWPGSKHEEYGGYFKRLEDQGQEGRRQKSESMALSSSTMATTEEAPDEWYGKSNPMASWEGYRHPQFGGYLDTLSSTSSSTTGGEESSSSSTLPAGMPSYLDSI